MAECERCGESMERGACAVSSCPTALSNGRNACPSCGARNVRKGTRWLCSAKRCPWSSPPPDIRVGDRVGLASSGPSPDGHVVEIQTPSQMLERHGRRENPGLCLVEWDAAPDANRRRDWYYPQSLRVTRLALRGWRSLVRRIRRA